MRWGPLHGLGTALQLLTRLPLADLDYEEGDLLESVPWYPLVGAGLGLALAGLGVLGVKAIAPAVGVVLVLAAEALFTGALHDDAAADVADGLGGGRDIVSRLRIMKDSSVGAYGALTLILLTAMRAACLWELPLGKWVPALVLAHAVGRTVMLPVMRVLPYARAEGVAGDLMAGLDWRRVGLSAGICTVIALAAAGWWGLLVVPLSVALVVGFVRLYRAQLGGVTGDALGAVCIAGELLTMLLLTAIWH
jgi:adenosylcobinamide-GDP ribazoletransferase